MTAKLSFRKWLELENQKKTIYEAAERGDFPDKVFAFLSAAFDSEPNQSEPWQNSVFSFMAALALQPDRKLPLIKDAPGKSEKPAPWDYEGRTWAYWSHLIAKSYGWSLEYIAELDVNEALARIQEILTDEQLEMEFQYGLSEVAYPYNKSTKKSVFKPLSRPYWMRPSIAPIKQTKFRRDMLPVGLVQDLSGMPDEYNPLRGYVQKKTETKKIDPSPSP